MGKKIKKQTTVELKGNRVVIRYKSKRWATGYTLHSEKKSLKQQQFNNGRLKSAWNREQYEDANLSILKKKQNIDNLITEAYEKNIDEITYVETYHQDKNVKLQQLSITKNTLLVDAYSEYIHTVKSKSKKITAERSIERYFSELHRLERYKPETKLKEVTILWIEEFTEFLATPKKETQEVYDERQGRRFTVTKTVSQIDSTIIRFLKDLKSFFKHIQKYSEMSLPINDIQEYIEILSSKQPPEKEIIALTEEQWEEYKGYVPNEYKPSEIKTYDAFKFSVFTGLRWSDLTRLEDSHVIDGKIKMLSEKTNTYFEVPLKPEAEIIFNKYNRSFIGKFSQNQQQNKNLKKILRKLPSLQHNVQKTTFRLGKPMRETIKAHEQITFHSSRRTFASFCIRHGCTLDQIKLFCGWTDLRTLRKYISSFSRVNTPDDLPNF